ncbi:MAG: TetR/AcrR family transcriptional regulator [Eubacteriales bacterium]|nr:TetR/AcrR family transcriptional regulator [Eubacteriales bacterium]
MEAMLSLAKTTPIKEIRIDDITDHVGFCRRVFFYHFQSRREFLSDTLEYVFSDHRLYDGRLSVRENFYLLCECAYEHHHFLNQCILNKELSEELYEIIEKSLQQAVRNEVEADKGQRKADDAVKNWTCIFNASFLASHILLRLQRGSDIKCKEEYARDIRLMKDFFVYIEGMKISPLKVAFIISPFDGVSDVELKLMDAMKILAKEAPFEQILVSDVVRIAGISRTTFYKRNYSKHELRNRIWTYDILTILNQMVDEKGNIDYKLFRKSISEYYADNINLYGGGIIYNEYDSLYYALKYQYDKNIRSIVESLNLNYSYSGYAVNCIEYALIDCILSPITKQDIGKSCLENLGEKQICNLSDVFKYEMTEIWDEFIRDDE